MVVTKLILAAVLGTTIFGTAVSGRASIVQNGSFELPVVSGGFITVPPGGPTGWDVLGAPSSIDFINSYWTAADGSQSLDMNGLYYGVIGQGLTGLTVNQTYHLQFALSGNPDNGPAIKHLQVDVLTPLPSTAPYTPDVSDPNLLISTAPITFVGAPTAMYHGLFSYDYIAKGTTKADMKWEIEDVYFTASASTVYLQFTSRTVESVAGWPISPWGPALDAVSVVPVPLPAAVGVGFSMLGGFGALFAARKRLGRRRRIA